MPSSLSTDDFVANSDDSDHNIQKSSPDDAYEKIDKMAFQSAIFTVINLSKLERSYETLANLDRVEDSVRRLSDINCQPKKMIKPTASESSYGSRDCDRPDERPPSRTLHDNSPLVLFMPRKRLTRCNLSGTSLASYGSVDPIEERPASCALRNNR